jgi:hypothetical protein
MQSNRFDSCTSKSTVAPVFSLASLRQTLPGKACNTPLLSFDTLDSCSRFFQAVDVTKSGDRLSGMCTKISVKLQTFCKLQLIGEYALKWMSAVAKGNQGHVPPAVDLYSLLNGKLTLVCRSPKPDLYLGFDTVL